MSLSRQAGKNLIKSIGVFENVEHMVKRAVDDDRPTLVKSLSKNREKLDEAFQNLFIDFKAYKKDVNVTEIEFNAVETEVNKYEYNDNWFTSMREAYYALVEASDDVLETLNKAGDEIGDSKEIKTQSDLEISSKHEEKLVAQLANQVESLTKSISGSVDKLSTEIRKMSDGTENVAKIEAFKKDLACLDEKIDCRFQGIFNQYVCLLGDVEIKEKEAVRDNFVNLEKARIDNLLILLNQKIMDKPSSTFSSGSSEKKHDQTYLKKIDPPDYKGDIIEYADFVRKWKAQVGKAGLNPDSELDRLRDHVHAQASRALYGETTMAGAWNVLDKLYGDKDLVANKLKVQLKNIKPKGRNDHDVIIDLVTEVNNISLRLKTLNMDQILQVDSEFLSAVFRVLPSNSQLEWLKLYKSTFNNKWDGLMQFLDTARDQALQTKVLLSTYQGSESDDKAVECKKCGSSDHKIKRCPLIKANSVSAAGDDSEDRAKKKLMKKQKEECGKCPLCSQYHTFTKWQNREEWPTDRMFKCEKFQKLSLKDRAAALESHKACAKCTSWNHQKTSCKSFRKCGNMVNGVKCDGEHSTLVCGSGSAYCGSVRVSTLSSSTESLSSISSATSSSGSSSLDSSSESLSSSLSASSDGTFPDVNAETALLFQDVKVLGAGEARSCWDNGSTRALVTHKYAKEHALRSQPMMFRLDVVASGKGTPQEGVLYMFTLVTNSGAEKKVWAFGVDEIMETPEPVSMVPIRHLFPHVPEDVFTPLVKKPVDLLIGNNFFHLHPDGGQGRDAAGDLKALHSQFGLGWVIAGSHSLLKPVASPLTLAAHCIAKVNKCVVAPHLSPSFWEGDTLGVVAPKRCSKCLSCNQCTDPALIHSRKEQEELDELKKNTVLLEDGIHVKYVFGKDPNCLPNNRNTVIKIASKQEQRLKKSGHLDFYNQEIQKYIDRGGVVKLSKDESDAYKGPVNYISHHGVERDSATTPLRVVTNSSLNNGGNSLNSCLVGGPNSLNPMLDIALRFRCHECGLVFDLTKAYNSLLTGVIEKNLRRFVWRFNQEEDWQDFAFDCVAFGDLPAANFLEIGRDITADAGVEIDHEASLKIKRDSYVDDCITGGTFEDVKRMKGVKLADGSFSGSMSKILKIGKLTIKTLVSSGETDDDAMALIGNKVLGNGWDASSDMMSLKFPIYLNNKKRKCRVGPPLTKESMKELLPQVKVTRRICLGIANAFGDFIGIASPFTLRFKLLMKQLFEPGVGQLDWDKQVHGGAVEAWLHLIAEAVESESLIFPRSTRPEKAIGPPTLVGFGDGAFPAFGASVYVRWETECQHSDLEECSGDYEANLLCAKSKVTPLSGFSIPRSELSGTVLMTRLLKSCVKALQCDESMKPRSITPLVDSKCMISVLEKSVGALKPFFYNRVSETLDNIADMKKVCDVEDLHYVASKDNPADLATRGGVKLVEIGPGSFWQKGPLFLCLRRDLWPVSRDFVADSDIPEEEIRMKRTFFSHLRITVLDCCAMNVHPIVPGQAGDLYQGPHLWAAVQRVLLYSNCFVKVQRILARVIKGWKIKSRSESVSSGALGEPTAEELQQAEQLILLSAMPLTAKAWHEEKLDSLCPQKEGHIISTTGRLGGKSLSRLLGVASLPILLPNSRAALLYMIRAHEGEHGTEHKSIVETLAKSRQSVWIIRARQLAKKVCSNCFKCKREKKKLAGQRMAKLKEESLTVCRPWTYVSLDFCGPIKVKGAVNKRAKMKCWIIVYCCRSTKAVCLLVTCGYSTEDFLLRHEEFVSRHAAPAQIVSDRGSQLVSAGRILAVKSSLAEKESPDQWNWKKITSNNATTSWKFVPVGCQHFNGLPEATVKVLKRSLGHALHPGVELSYPELVTLLSKISYSVNSRPLGLCSISNSSQQEDIMLPLTPNMMLLGKSSNLSPPMIYSADEKFCRRLAYVDQVEQEWWSRWYKQVLPTLFTYKKWKRKQTNLQVGDIVMMQYPGHFKDDYTLAKVSAVHPDDEGLVRVVTVQYRKKDPRESSRIYKSKPLLSEQVAIHRLHRLDLADEEPDHDAVQGGHEDNLSEGVAVNEDHQ